MSDDDFERLTRDVRTLTSIISRMAHASFEQQLNQSELGVSPMQFAVMRSLCRSHHTISELSRKFAVDPSTLVPVIDSLERKGLVQRQRDEQDRRRVPVALTDDGKQLFNRPMPVDHEDPFYKALSAMGKRRAGALRKLLMEVLAALPEGDTILHDVMSRLDAVGGAEAAVKKLQEARHEPEHDHLKRRLIERRRMMRKGRA